MVNLRSVDLNLLPVFEAVYEERNVTRAADRLAMSQPAVSNSIARMRAAVGDELFVAGRRGAVVTPLAERLYPKVRSALDAVREALGETREFVPGESDRRFTVGALYGFGSRFVGEFVAWMKRDAPRLSWKWLPIEDREAGTAALRAGRLDFLVDHARPSASDLQAAELFSDDLVVIAAAGHSRIGDSLTRKQFLAERHIVHRSLRYPGNLPQIEEALGHQSLDVALEVREPIELPITVARTDFIAVANRRLVAPWLTTLGLKMMRTPFRASPFKVYVIWHSSRRRDAGHRWVRDGAVRIAAGLS